MRRLVQLDGDGWCMEIDFNRLRRVASEFQTWLLAIDSTQDRYGFLKQDLPLVKSALHGNMILPYKGFEPHTRELGRGCYLANTLEFLPLFITQLGVQIEVLRKLKKMVSVMLGWILRSPAMRNKFK